MGNRGILHDADRRIVKRWTTKAWVACDPNFRGISRKPLFSPNNYSELFFLDEATALAAGHRPCAYCQRGRFNAFKEAWAGSVGAVSGAGSVLVEAIDTALHAQRAARGVEKIVFSAQIESLPEGSIFAVGDDAYLLHRDTTWRWSFLGYERAHPLPSSTEVSVLTPESVVRLYSMGFKPCIHASACV